MDKLLLSFHLSRSVVLSLDSLELFSALKINHPSVHQHPDLIKKYIKDVVGLPKFGSGSGRFGSGSKAVRTWFEPLFYSKSGNTTKYVTTLKKSSNFDTGIRSK